MKKKKLSKVIVAYIVFAVILTIFVTWIVLTGLGISSVEKHIDGFSVVTGDIILSPVLGNGAFLLAAGHTIFDGLSSNKTVSAP